MVCIDWLIPFNLFATYQIKQIIGFPVECSAAVELYINVISFHVLFSTVKTREQIQVNWELIESLDSHHITQYHDW